MKVSVIIPVYNFPEIIETLDGLREQTFKDFEVILVDDESRDETVQKVKEYVIKHPELLLRVFLNKHKGPAFQRNFGAKNAKGEILVFTDADCYPRKNFIEEMIKPFENSKIIGVGGTYETWNKNSFTAKFTGYEIALRHERMRKIKYIDFIGTYAAAYKKNIFLSENGFDESFETASGEDPDFSFKLAQKGYKMIFNPNAITKHKHPATLMHYLKQKFIRGYWRVRLYKKFPKKVKGETYTPFYVLIQIPLFFLILISIPLALLSIFIPLLWIPLVALLLLQVVLTLIEGIGLIKYDFIAFLASPIYFSLRSASSSLGVLKAMIEKRFLE